MKALLWVGLLAAVGCGAAGPSDTGTTGGSAGACGADCNTKRAGMGDGMACSTNADCNCPLACADDPLLGRVCSGCCTTSQDCADSFETCQGGSCRVDVCAGDGGPYYQRCDAGGSLDGTCVPEPVDAAGNLVGLCYQGGSAPQRAPCNPRGQRTSLSEICVTTDVCAPDVQAGGTSCRQACDPTSSGPSLCTAPEVCQSFELQGGVAQQGICAPRGPGGCNTIAEPTEFMSCTQSSMCQCPELCFFDPGQGTSDCESPCGAGGTCDDSRTVCVDGGCALNYCVADLLGHSAPGTYGAPCDAAGLRDGFCTPYEVNGDGGAGFGLCLQTGTSTNSCDPMAPRHLGRDSYCVPGDYCDILSGGVCIATCLSGSDAGAQCGAGMLCLPYVATMGICQPCGPPASECFSDGDCCSSSCVPDAGLSFCR